MKKSFMILAVMGAVAFTACSEEKKEEGKKEEKKEEAITGYYTIDNASSSVNWLGQNRDAADHKHEGTIALSGEVVVEDGKIKNATAVADLGSIKVTDLAGDEGKHAGLVGHLMAPEFFAADTVSPAANPVFIVQSVEEGIAKGVLSIRGVEIGVSVPVNVEITKDEVKVTSDAFTIDFLPFSMPFFAQEKEAKSKDDHITILKGEVSFSGLNIVAKRQGGEEEAAH
jgi:hypothetical protein